MSLKEKISRTFRTGEFPFVGSMAMRNVVQRFVYIGRIIMPSWLTPDSYRRLEPPKIGESLLDTILSELSCPVCHGHMIEPIYQCDNGHPVCDYCVEDVPACAICKVDLCYTPRCYVLEEIADQIVLPCRYKRNGCSHQALGKDLTKHHETCWFSPHRCLFWYCRWYECKHLLRAHLAQLHRDNYYEGSQVTITTDNIYSEVYPGWANYTAMIYAYEKFFVLDWKIHDTGDTHWAIFHQDQRHSKRKKYSYKLVFHPLEPVPNETLVMVHRQPLNPGENADLPLRSRFGVHESLLTQYCRDEVLTFTVMIFKRSHAEYTEKHITRVEKFTSF